MHVTYAGTLHCYEHRLFALSAHGPIRGKKTAIMECLGLRLCIRVSHERQITYGALFYTCYLEPRTVEQRGLGAM